MKPVEFHPEADADFASAQAFYERKRHRLAVEFTSQLERAVSALRDRPAAGSVIRGSVRRWLVRRFPYSIIYREESERIFVLAVAHQRQRPSFWYDRM